MMAEALANSLGLLLPGALLVHTLLLALWLVSLRTGNASIVDAGWAYGLALMALSLAAAAPGYFWRTWIMTAMSVLWGLRLGTYLLARILGRNLGREEEGRYKELRRRWKTGLRWKFLAFFQAQAVLVVLLSVVFLLPALNPEPRLSALEILGVALWLMAWCGESLADRQLAAFKREFPSPEMLCQRGLWRYSRHPNYFFEWLIWVAWALYAAASPWGWAAFAAPLLMLYLLFRVTGIPATEQQALRSKGEAYREYQKTTSAFVPWFRRPGFSGRP